MASPSVHSCRAASKGPRRTSVPGVLGVLGRRRAAAGEHRLLEVLHVTVPPPRPIPDIGTLTPGSGGRADVRRPGLLVALCRTAVAASAGPESTA
jgi:hypothetical protein